MSKVKRWTLLTLVLLFSIGVSAFGLWLFRRGLIDDNRECVNIGFYLLFGGMTVVPIGLGIAGNYFIKSEGAVSRQPRRPFSAFGTKQQLKILNRKRKARAMCAKHREHPGRFLLFCLLGLVAGLAIGGAGLFGELHPSYAQDSPGGFIFIGALFIVLSVWAFVLCLRKVIQKQWVAEYDILIAKLDVEIRELEEAAANGPSSTKLTG